MEMEEDHTNHYSIPDISQLINAGRTHFPTIMPSPPPPEYLFSGHHHREYDNMLMMSAPPLGTLRDFRSFPATFAAAAVLSPGNNNVVVAAATSSSTISGGGGGVAGGCAYENEASGAGAIGNGRWPRQETLTLLEIRSRLDPKFKEANQKGPLWDEVSRIMFEEHGYQRNGKKCREKFENLYKYYKKTKEGRAGRQDGKNYRFFRQLEALYGDANVIASTSQAAGAFPSSHNHQCTAAIDNNISFQQLEVKSPNIPEEASFQSRRQKDLISLSNNNSLDLDSSSLDDNDLNASISYLKNGSGDQVSKKRRGTTSSWKKKVKDFVDSQMRKIVKKQEAWLESIMKIIEQKEQERVIREQEWRTQEADRLEREQKFWASERAWIEARDAAFVEALQKFTGRQVTSASADSFDQMPPTENSSLGGAGSNNRYGEKQGGDGGGEDGGGGWMQCEMTRLVQLRTSMESRFEESGCREDINLWEEIAAKMSYLGYDRNALMWKSKWDSINSFPYNKNVNEDGQLNINYTKTPQ